jgi:adenylate cyclase
VLINLMLGKYHSPRMETRIFMFLDMKDSTTHAENLGHVQFSSLIQDGMKDLTRAIIEHKVEIYQYVGDEAVLTWGLRQGFENLNCLQVYYTFLRPWRVKRNIMKTNMVLSPSLKPECIWGM